jgi:hypothetical protein
MRTKSSPKLGALEEGGENNLLPLREEMFFSVSFPFFLLRIGERSERSGKVVCKFHQIKVERVIIMISVRGVGEKRGRWRMRN